MAEILDGLALSRLWRSQIKDRVVTLLDCHKVPRFDVLVASHDPSSLAYVKMKKLWAEHAGIDCRVHLVDESWSRVRLLDTIHDLNTDIDVHGILVQHPLSLHLDELEALSTLHLDKDVDGMSPGSLGLLAARMPGHRCATPLGILRLLDHYQISLKGKHVVVVGCSAILGLPASLMFLEREATVCIAHKYTKNVPELCREADILLTAVGIPEMFKGDWIKPGAVVIDSGYTVQNGKPVGDVEFSSASLVASWITPVPGGVGPMTVATLLSNVLDAAERINGNLS